MLFLEGYTKQIYIASAAQGAPGWAIRVTNGKGRTVTFLALSWRLRPSPGELRGCGGVGDEMLTPHGPAYWVETTAAVDADVVEPEAAVTPAPHCHRIPPASGRQP